MDEVAKANAAIKKAVKNVNDFDAGIKAALEAAVTEKQDKGARGGFNSDAKDVVPESKGHGDKASAEGWRADGLLKGTGPDMDAKATGVGYGKEGTAKAYIELAHATAKGEVTNGNFKLSGIADLTADARASASFGMSNTGIAGEAGASVGVRGLVEGRVEGNHTGAYARGSYFAGAEAKATAALGVEETGLGAEAFAGTKQSGAAGVEIGGIGIGGTAEAWEGAGAEAYAGWKQDEEGKWHIGANAGLADVVGGSVGAEITVDPGKVADTAKDVSDASVDVGGDIKDGVTSLF